MFYKDEAGKMDKPNPLAENATDRNSGLVRRHAFATESREIDMIGRIHSDIFFQEKYTSKRSECKDQINQEFGRVLSHGDR
jgi:hypothetical protein